ncbi:hypothetical protein [Streptomyces sp. NPDC047928]|uniref:hypothetical protein n=1 Tax=unclassified Streptomyces TaxID=2593676 RepID=UPI003713750A
MSGEHDMSAGERGLRGEHGVSAGAGVRVGHGMSAGAGVPVHLGMSAAGHGGNVRHGVHTAVGEDRSGIR